MGCAQPAVVHSSSPLASACPRSVNVALTALRNTKHTGGDTH